MNKPTKPCMTETRRVLKDGTFQFDNKLYRAINLPPLLGSAKWTRYGVAVRDDGSVYLRKDYDWVCDAEEVMPNAVPLPLLERLRPYINHTHECWASRSNVCTCGLGDILPEMKNLPPL